MIDELKFAQQMYHARNLVHDDRDVELLVVVTNTNESFSYWTKEQILLGIYNYTVEWGETIRLSGYDDGKEYRPIELRRMAEDSRFVYYKMVVEESGLDD